MLYFGFPLQESHKRVKKEKNEPLDDDQLFVVELALDLSRVCQVQPTVNTLDALYTLYTKWGGVAQ